MEKVLSNLKLSFKQISNKIRFNNSLNLGNSFINTFNKSGEAPKELDLICNDILKENLSLCESVRCLASEEEDNMVMLNKDGDYLVTFDPLDGSSCISSNLPIGTIFSIWKYKTKDHDVHHDVNHDLENNIDWTNSSRLPSLMGANSLSGSFEKDYLQNGYDMVYAGYCIYSYSTQLVTADKNSASLELLNSNNSFQIIDNDLKMSSKGSTYSYNSAYEYVDNRVGKLVSQLNNLDYSHRYVGSLVADVHRTILDGGIFMYPATNKNKNGKLRLLYEAYPMAFIIDKTGGTVTNGSENILDVPFPENNIHERTSLYVMSNEEYRIFNSI